MTTYRREIRAQIRPADLIRMPDQGSSVPLLMFFGTFPPIIGILANFKPDRERVRDGEASHRPHEGRAV